MGFSAAGAILANDPVRFGELVASRDAFDFGFHGLAGEISGRMDGWDWEG
jgi:hypothetical protein